jgi:hypothetical protein
VCFTLRFPNTQAPVEIALKLLEIIFIPAIFLLSGIILLFNGWRLDPILAFQQLLLFIVVFYFIIKDNFLLYK